MFLDVHAKALSVVVALSLSAWMVPTAYAEDGAGPSDPVSLTAAEAVDDGESASEPESTQSALEEGLPSEDAFVAGTTEKADRTDSAPGGFEGGWVIRSMCGDMQVLDVEGGSSSNGANLQTYRSNMSLAQRFSIEVDEDGYAVIVNEASGKVLDVAGGVAEPGANVQLYERNGSDAQRWVIELDADGCATFVSALDEELALDVSGGAAFDGANVGLWSRNSTPAQSFELISDEPEVASGETVAPGVYALSSSLGGGLVADVVGASLGDGAGVQLWGSNGTLAQAFLLVVDERGYAVIRNVNSGKALDVASGNLVPGAKVQQWEASEGNVNQLWSLRGREDGSFDLISCANGLALGASGASSGCLLSTVSPGDNAVQGWILDPVERLVKDGVYTIESLLGSDLALDVKDASFENGAKAQVWSRNGSPAQKFKVSEEEAGMVSIQPLTAGGQYLTAFEDGSVAFCTAVEGLSQLWAPQASPEGGVVFVSALTGKALDVSGAGAWPGCPVGSFSPNGTDAQAFRPVPTALVSSGTYTLQFLSDGRVLDVSGGSRSNGANVQAWTPNGSGAQVWQIEETGDGYCKIVNARSKKALDVSAGASVPGTNVQQWAVDDVAAQKWRFELGEGGSYVLVSACGGLALDLAGGGGFDGANVQVYDRNGSEAQSIRLVPTTYVPEDFEDLIASFTTYSTNTPAGTYNMQRALNSFNGVVIQPGSSLSFFAVAGPCGAAEGYLPAGVVGGVGYGGGICQASTTLYGAAIRAGFAILDRQNHSVPSTYVPIGLDAMVNWGTSDLVVRNDTGYPVKIVVHTYGNVLTCEMWGIQPDWYDSVEPVSWHTGPSSAAAQRTFYKDGRAVLTQALPSSWYW